MAQLVQEQISLFIALLLPLVIIKTFSNLSISHCVICWLCCLCAIPSTIRNRIPMRTFVCHRSNLNLDYIWQTIMYFICSLKLKKHLKAFDQPIVRKVNMTIGLKIPLSFTALIYRSFFTINKGKQLTDLQNSIRPMFSGLLSC